MNAHSPGHIRGPGRGVCDHPRRRREVPSMTMDLEPDAAVCQAALWLAADPDPAGRAIVPEIRCRFGLTTAQAIDAMRRAQQLRDHRYREARHAAAS